MSYNDAMNISPTERQFLVDSIMEEFKRRKEAIDAEKKKRGKRS